MKKYCVEVELQSFELNLGLRRSAMVDCDRYRLQQGLFRKVRSGFQSISQNNAYNFKYYFPGNVHIWMEISIIQGNEKIPFWSHVTKA